MPLFLTGKVKYLFLIWRCADKYIGAFSVYAGICTVCMQNRAGQQVCKDFFRSVSVLEENSRQSLSIIPLKFSAFHLSNQRESAGFYQWKLHSLYLTEIKVTWCCHHSSHHQPLLREKLHGLFSRLGVTIYICLIFRYMKNHFNGNKLFGYDLLCFEIGSSATILGAGRCTVWVASCFFLPWWACPGCAPGFLPVRSRLLDIFRRFLDCDDGMEEFS